MNLSRPAETMQKPIRATNLWAEAQRVLREQILAGRLRPGAKLVEAEVAAQLGVSRNPVREALARLEQQGLVTVVPNQGAYVVNPTRAQVRDALLVRVHLEILAVRLAMANPEPGKLDPLRRVVGELEALRGGGAGALGRASLLDAEFHQHLVRCSRSEALQRIWDAAAPLDLIFVYELAEELEHEDIEARLCHEAACHARLLDALLGGDAGVAERGLREHFTERLPEMGLDIATLDVVG